MSNLFRREINVETGEEKIIYLTDEEVQALQEAEALRKAQEVASQPTLAELQAQLNAIAAQIAALSANTSG